MSHAVFGHNDCICWVSHTFCLLNCCKICLRDLQPYVNSIIRHSSNQNSFTKCVFHLHRCLTLSGHKDFVICWWCSMHIVCFKIRITGSASLCIFRNTTLHNRMLSISKRSVDSNNLIKNTWFPMLRDLRPYADCVTHFKTWSRIHDSQWILHMCAVRESV